MENTQTQENKRAASLQQQRAESARNQRIQLQNSASENYELDNDSRLEEKISIPFIQGMCMIAVALLIDGIQAFLTFIIIGFAVNWIISIIAWFIFYIWLKSFGISINTAKGSRTLLFMGGATIIELIPGFNAIPTWTAFAIGTVLGNKTDQLIERTI